MNSTKKTYIKPYAEKIGFNYKDQIVASNSSNMCHWEVSVSHSLIGCHDKQIGEGAMNA